MEYPVAAVPTAPSCTAPFETFLALSLNGLPMSTILSPSFPNHAPQACMTFSRSAGFVPALPPVYRRTKFAITDPPWVGIHSDDERGAEISTSLLLGKNARDTFS